MGVRWGLASRCGKAHGRARALQARALRCGFVREQDFEAPGSPEAPFFFLAFGACDALVASQHGSWTRAATLCDSSQTGKASTRSRGTTENGGRRDTREGGTQAGGGVHLAGRGGAGRSRRRRGGPAPGSAACTWHRPRLLGGGVVGIDPAPTGPCGRRGSAEQSPLSVWALATTSLRLSLCLRCDYGERNFSETCVCLPALL